MRAPNSAYWAGRRIGRTHPDVWVSKDELREQVIQQIAPQIKLPNGNVTRFRENMTQWATALRAYSTTEVGPQVAGFRHGAPRLLDHREGSRDGGRRP